MSALRLLWHFFVSGNRAMLLNAGSLRVEFAPSLVSLNQQESHKQHKISLKVKNCLSSTSVVGFTNRVHLCFSFGRYSYIYQNLEFRLNSDEYPRFISSYGICVSCNWYICSTDIIFTSSEEYADLTVVIFVRWLTIICTAVSVSSMWTFFLLPFSLALAQEHDVPILNPLTANAK